MSIKDILLTPCPILERGSESPEGETKLFIFSIFGSAKDPMELVFIIFCLSDRRLLKSSRISKSSDSILASASTLVNGINEGNKNNNVRTIARREGSKSNRGRIIRLSFPITSHTLCVIYAIAFLDLQIC